MKKRDWIAALTAAILLTPGQAAYAGDTVYVNCDVLRCRSAAEIAENNVVGNFYRGQALERIGTEGDWSVVLVNGKKRYAASAYLTTVQTNAQAAASAVQSVVQEAGVVTEAQSAAQGTGVVTEARQAAQGPGSVTEIQSAAQESGTVTEIGLSSGWTYAEFSKINTGKALLYRTTAAVKKNKTVCVNAGHGTAGGSSVKTLCHPDGTPKVTGGTTGAGATTAVAVSSGMTFADGTAEAKVTLAMAKLLKERLLASGYDVLMIREADDVQLDNIARTVLANNKADCHIALHWDSTSNDKGAFYMSVPSNSAYRAMKPVASHWQKHNALGEALIGGLKGAGVKIFSGGSMEMDLTQTSYSTIPSVDIELGDKASDHSAATLSRLADGLVAGVEVFFGK